MKLILSHEMFAAKGDAWNTPNYQHSSGITLRHRRNPDGSLRDVEVEYRHEGYGPDGQPRRAPERRVVRSPKGKCVHDEQRRACARAMPKLRTFAPSGEHYHAPEELRGKAQPLTEAQLQKRARQRAAMKARMTRKVNALKAEQAEVAAMLQKFCKGE